MGGPRAPETCQASSSSWGCCVIGFLSLDEPPQPLPTQCPEAASSGGLPESSVLFVRAPVGEFRVHPEPRPSTLSLSQHAEPIPAPPSLSVCQHTPDKFLAGTLTNCRGPDPIWRRLPSRHPGDRAANRAPGTQRAPPIQGSRGRSPREGTDSLAAAASVRALWLCESGRCRGGADLVAHLQVQEHIY